MRQSTKLRNSDIMKTVYSTLFLSTLLSLPVCAHALETPANTDSTTPDVFAPDAVNQGTSSGLHVTLNAGLTYGGDKILEHPYQNGGTATITAGALMQFGLGGLYQFAEIPAAFMLSANYHFDTINAKNGEMSFDRFPIEVLTYYTGKEKFRIGAGMRFIGPSEASKNIEGQALSYGFDATKGVVAEIGYQLDPHGWLNFRFVSEKYQAKTAVLNGVTYSLAGSAPASGSHMGVNFTYEY
jgi:hypothetical protein